MMDDLIPGQDLMPGCQICIQGYSEIAPVRRPLVLICGHSFCQECIERIYKPLKCPICNVVHPNRITSVNYASEESIRGCLVAGDAIRRLKNQVEELIENLLEEPEGEITKLDQKNSQKPKKTIQSPDLTGQSYYYPRKIYPFTGKNGYRNMRQAVQYNFMEKAETFFTRLKEWYEGNRSSREIGDLYAEACGGIDYIKKFTENYPRPEHLNSEISLRAGKPVLTNPSYLGKRSR